MFTATPLQTSTYLFAVCLFSIAFLVFVNSSVSFVVTDLLGLPNGTGDAVGTLGFADELLALVACPAWGVLSDRVGVRYVCTAGYAIIALALVLFVQTRNVYPELLLARLLFSLGGSAVSTMVTAVLPAVTENLDLLDERSLEDTPGTGTEDSCFSGSGQSRRGSTLTSSSELTITPFLFQNRLPEPAPDAGKHTKGSASRLAGYVGMFTGCGAVLALLLFLPLPAQFEKAGRSSAEAIKLSYYVVASIALVVSVTCFIGLRSLEDEREALYRSLAPPPNIRQLPDEPGISTETSSPGEFRHSRLLSSRHPPTWCPFPVSSWAQFNRAFFLGFRYADIGVGYVGGFVARASSVGISLFVPLYVNQYYRTSGLCQEGIPPEDLRQILGTDLGDIKNSCPRAYIVASILTGTSQLTALICAPAFGYLSEKSRRYHIPLLFAGLAGIIGYLLLSLLPSPKIQGRDGSSAILVAMMLIGISQIGAIVCSLAVISNGVLEIRDHQHSDQPRVQTDPVEYASGDAASAFRIPAEDEQVPLLPRLVSPPTNNLSRLKGSIAGMYSFYGGAGILLLTKLGGILFDKFSLNSPFYMLAIFNGVLLSVVSACGLCRSWPLRALPPRT